MRLPGCTICPFADDPDIACAAIVRRHPAFCASRHPNMPAAVRKLTLQGLGLWVEPEPPVAAGPSASPPSARPSYLDDPAIGRRYARMLACPSRDVASCRCAGKADCRRFGRRVLESECLACDATLPTDEGQ